MTVSDPIPGQFDDADDIGESDHDLVRNKVIDEESPVSDGGYQEDDSDGDYSDEDYFDVDLDQKKDGDNPNQQMAKSKLNHYQPNEKILKKFTGKIYVGQYDVEDKSSGRVRDKADRATVEQVMDPRTRMILFKLLNKGFMSEIDGCISTGKEANVYHCEHGSRK